MDKIDIRALSEITNSSLVVQRKVKLTIRRAPITDSTDDVIVISRDPSDEVELKFNSKHVFDCKPPTYEDEITTRPVHKDKISKCLMKVATKSCHSISFPAFGVDLGCPPEYVALWMVEAIVEHCDNFPRSSLTNVSTFIDAKDEHTQKCFDDVMYDLRSMALEEKELSEITSSSLLIRYKVCLKIIKGDISESQDDVIVNSTGRNFDLSVGGTSKSLAQKAGIDLQKECTGLAPLGVGAVVGTSGHKLKCKQVLHCNCPVYRGHEQKDELKSIIRKCLTLTATSRYESISFPAIGTGNLNYSASNVAKWMIEEIVEHCDMFPRNSISAVNIVIYDKDTSSQQGFASYMRSLIYKDVSDVHLLIYNRLHFDVLIGNMADSIEDTVVNSAESDLSLYRSSFSKNLATKAGPQYVKACSEQDSLTAPCVVRMDSHDMPCEQILHCVCQPWSEATGSEHLKKMVNHCLEFAEQEGHRSIAFPALGMVDKDYPPSVVCKSTIEAITEYSEKNPLSSLTTVKLFLYEGITASRLEIFQWTLRMYGCKKLTDGFLFTNGTSLTVKKGDLTDTKVDVMINSTGSHLSTGGGNPLVELMNMAGKALQEEATRLAPILAGEMVMTGGFGLPCNNVLHVQCPYWLTGRSEKELRDLIIKCLDWANDIKATTIAFPTIGTGKLRYPPDTVARCFVHAAADFAKRNRKGTVKEIKLITFINDSTAIEGVEKALDLKLTLQESSTSRFSPIRSKPTEESSDGKIVIDLPSCWQIPVNEYREFSVVQDTKEWQDVVADFNATLNRPRCAILKISRIQNPVTYRLYDIKRKSVARKLNKQESEVETAPLWHGTSASSVSKITNTMFDRGLSREPGMNKLGSGCYFSVSSNYSSGGAFSPANAAGERHMILARVVTGDFCVGTSSMTHSPYKSFSKHEQYDSVVDNKLNPSMYAVFQDASAYPEYVIKYKY